LSDRYRGALEQLRRIAALTALLSGICASGVACAEEDRDAVRPTQTSEASSQHRDRLLGWVVDVPRGYRVSRFDRWVGLSAQRGSVIATFPLGDKPWEALERMPTDGVAFVLDFAPRHARPDLLGADTTLPLRLDSFAWLTRRSAPIVRRYSNVDANGYRFIATAYIGSRSSRAQAAALTRLVASVRFRGLPERRVTPSGFYVLGKASRYRIPSVTQVPKLPRSDRVWRRPFHLVRSPGGFYALAHVANLQGGFPACKVRFDSSRFEFTCANGARWDRTGRVLAAPRGRSYKSTPFAILSTRTTHDGKVMVSGNAYTHASPDLVRRFWGT
jgi:hypothetical protein